MKLVVACALASAACYQPLAETSCTVRCTAAAPCASNQTCERGLCRDIEGPACGSDAVDAGGDAFVEPIDAPPGCIGTNLARYCPGSLPGGQWTVAGTITINTDSDPLCAGNEPSACVIAWDSISISGKVSAIGTRPLILVAITDITIPVGGVVDVSSRSTDNIIGAAANSPSCGQATAGTASGGDSGGGAGGSFGGSGGFGGASGAGGATGGQPAGLGSVVFNQLRGGCPGSAGGGNAGGSAGSGGGAVALLAGGNVAVAGFVMANGGYGKAGAISAGGGGGGSGGLIIVDAQSVNITGAVLASGGGGGGGSGNDMLGTDGTESGTQGSSSGGQGGGADAGAGGASNGAPASFLNGRSGGTTSSTGAGGGGGGAGLIGFRGALGGGGLIVPVQSL